MNIVQRYPKLAHRARHRAEVLQADERKELMIELCKSRFQRRMEASEREVPEQDHLDILKAFEPHVSMFLLLAVVAFVAAVIALVITI